MRKKTRKISVIGKFLPGFFKLKGSECISFANWFAKQDIAGQYRPCTDMVFTKLCLKNEINSLYNLKSEKEI